MAGPSTSPIGPSTPVSGLLLQIGTAGSPETAYTIANVSDVSLPIVLKTEEVTNVGDLWVRRVPTLLDMGKITFKLYWVMEEVTHRNAINGGAIPAGLRYVMINKLVRDYFLTYADGNNSTDSFPAYVTAFSISGKVGTVWEASVELSNSGQPSLV